MASQANTIVALSTAPGFGAIAVVRLTGPISLSIISTLTNKKAFKPRLATFTKIFYKTNHLDDIIVTYFKAPESYTGEDVVEISCHGSQYIIERIIELCINEGARNAEPGEFTKRAFLNGKMDLSQAEGVADIIHTQTQAAHLASTNLLDGHTGIFIKKCQKQLIDIISLLELELDFSDQEIDFTPKSKIENQLVDLQNTLQMLIQSFNYGKLVKEGIRVPIIGPPNSGKSSLLNAFLQEERVIVSPTAGTTRDSIEESFRRGGYQFRLIDTAGLRQTTDSVEQKGIERTNKYIQQADLILFIIDPSKPVSDFQKYLPNNLDDTIIILNKIDIISESQLNNKQKYFKNFNTITISAKTHNGIHRLADKMVNHIKVKRPKNENIIITRKRHKYSLINTKQSLEHALFSIKDNQPSEIIVMDLRIALDSLSEILGKVYNDDILNNIFKNFCIGK